jgi:glyoxylase-like metal-dependent hydrolase (beta-lactamase superfamily II)
MHHALQCREPDWSTIFDYDPAQGVQSRRRLLGQVADTSTLILPIHFPNPTVGRVSAHGDRGFNYTFVR